MPVAPDMFQSLDTIYVLLRLAHMGEDDAQRDVALTVQNGSKGKRFSVTMPVDRYSPESSIMRAVASVMEQIERLQEPLTRPVFVLLVGEAFRQYVEPF